MPKPPDIPANEAVSIKSKKSCKTVVFNDKLNGNIALQATFVIPYKLNK